MAMETHSNIMRLKDKPEAPVTIITILWKKTTL